MKFSLTRLKQHGIILLLARFEEGYFRHSKKLTGAAKSQRFGGTRYAIRQGEIGRAIAMNC
jgi:hypothetical protein